MVFLRALVCGALLCVFAFAASPDYFPLHPGNQWVYRCSGLCGEPLVVAGVSRMDYVGGVWYSVFEGFGGNRAWLRQDELGTVWALDRATGKEQLWYSFFTPTGQPYQTFIQPCSRQASIASRTNPYEGPAGKFPETLQIVYPPGPCSDAGLTEEIFYRWTGLMRRTETTIAGPRTYDLLYARTGAVTVVSQPELHFSVSLDKSVYTANLMPPVDPATSIPQLTARLTLRNTTDKPVTLEFPSGQRYDLEIKNAAGKPVYRWSDGQAFIMMLGSETIGPGEKDYVVVVRLADSQGKPFAPGKYTAEGWMTTSGSQPYRASAGFEVRHVN